MPVTFEILTSPDVVVARYCGHVTAVEISSVFAQYRADPAFRIDRPHLVEVAPDMQTDAGFDEIFALFSMFERAHAALGVPMRVAICAPDDTVFGIARIFEALAENSDWVRFAIFDQQAPALDWLAALP